MWVKISNRSKLVRFKVDTGCNAVVLSHKTLKRLGCPTDSGALSKLPGVTGTQVSGDVQNFKMLGEISLFDDNRKSIHICDTQAVCHETHETHDLLGTEALRKFRGVLFNLHGDKFMELLK
jgi:hypothetical protein